MKIATQAAGLRRIGRSREIAAAGPPEEQTDGFWQNFTTAPAAGKRGIDAWHRIRRPPGGGRGYHDRLYLCRIARRLRLQPGPCARRRGAEENARPQGGGGRKSPGDRRSREDHGVDDQSRRRDAAVSDLVRILQPAHDQDGEQVSKTSLRALRDRKSVV